MRDIINVCIPDQDEYYCDIGPDLYVGELVKISINGDRPVLCVVTTGLFCEGCYIHDRIGHNKTASCPRVQRGLACIWSTDSSLKFRAVDAMLEDL